MKLKLLIILTLGAWFSLCTNNSFATHLRGGEISIKRISTTALTYEFTLTIYCDLITGQRAWIEQKEVNFCFGDGLGVIIKAPRSNGPGGMGENLGDGVAKGVYKAIYTFAAPSSYRITVAIPNRNANVRNLSQPSDALSFYVETLLQVNPGLGLNSTPILLNPAVDLTAVVGQRFIHNANAIDIEGDSLAYSLTVCRQGEQDNCRDRGQTIRGFVQPNEVSSVASNFTIDARTGDLVWDVPQEEGLYNCAFIVEEWRNGTRISITVRDMQIEVKAADNAAPKIKVPEDICVEAGTVIDQVITATDTPSKTGRLDNLNLQSTGAVYRLPDGTTFIPADYAVFTAENNQVSPASGRFLWRTNCNHVRQEPYDILFKVLDAPASRTVPSLVDSKNWRIKVIAPRIKNLTLTPDAGNRTMTLRWDSYACQNAGAVIIIYRKEGCSTYKPAVCTVGLPASEGYVEVARVPVNATTFTDRNLKRNTDYSYRTLVQFTNGTNSTMSVVSDQACANLPFQGSVITNVTVDRTNTTTGEITVRWTRPVSLDRIQFRGPYQYRLFRATGETGSTGFAQVSPNIDTDLTAGRLDTLFTDKALNTTDNAYRYRLVFYYTANGGLTPLDTTENASSVRLSATGDVRTVNLAWQATVPWNNQNQVHRVYRETRAGSGVFNRIADVPVTNTGTFRFTDTGTDTYTADGTATVRMSPDSSYCYKVETVGTYGDPKIRPALLYNFSQITCATPKSDIIPCPPNLLIDVLDCNVYNKDESNCNLTSFNNKLTWTNPDKSASGAECDKDIVKYTIYYAPRPDADFTKIGEVTSPRPPAQTFTHTKTDSYLGCYYVTATNRFGVESPRSNVVCKDNCTSFELPNIFTPNGDGKNDIFQAMKCPRFVQSVTFMAYNRAGQKVFEYTGPKLEWNGNDLTGNQLPSGSYFYTCEVKFRTLDPNSPTLSLKGWVELAR
ncbi:MAG: gliding motility-associated C-terminal domain-containing protein [Arcicella sp.]|jgi:gliding motility-associated-like protein|nr:gliding motility-associated C-terminal domain-containing protein [Arcicella sp.]